MKKIVLLLLVLVCALAFAVSCGDTATTAAPDTTTEDPAIEKFESLKIADNALDGYTIVYAESTLKAKAEADPALYPVWDFNKETAERLSDLIFEVSGVRLPIGCDTETAEGEKEILIGKTNRAATKEQSLASLKGTGYVVRVLGTTVVICGGREGATWHAIDYIEETFDKELAAGNANYALAADLSYSGTFNFIRIGCIGDSITQGVGAGYEAFAYSSPLERYLWKDVMTYNFGNSGRTMRDDLADSFMKTPTFKEALSFASSIDIFTVMLGTNDSNRDHDWKKADTAKFKFDCETLFQKLLAKNENLQFVIMNCPACFGTRDTEQKFGSATVREIQYELVGIMNSKGYKTSFFDMYEATKDLGEYFDDDLHPNAYGQVIMAERLSVAIDQLINGDK